MTQIANSLQVLERMAGTTGLEPAASAVTGQRSNQLNYVPTRQINEMRNRQCLCGFARFAYRAWNCLRCPKERDSCPNRPQTAPNFGIPCTFAMCKTALHRVLRAIQIVANLDETANKT